MVLLLGWHGHLHAVAASSLSPVLGTQVLFLDYGRAPHLSLLTARSWRHAER